MIGRVESTIKIKNLSRVNKFGVERERPDDRVGTRVEY